MLFETCSNFQSKMTEFGHANRKGLSILRNVNLSIFSYVCETDIVIILINNKDSLTYSKLGQYRNILNKIN